MNRNNPPSKSPALRAHTRSRLNVPLNEARASLSEQAIEEIWWEIFPTKDKFSLPRAIYQFARAIEASHGIAPVFKD